MEIEPSETATTRAATRSLASSPSMVLGFGILATVGNDYETASSLSLPSYHLRTLDRSNPVMQCATFTESYYYFSLPILHEINYNKLQQLS